jgi:hypothetical protein
VFSRPSLCFVCVSSSKRVGRDFKASTLIQRSWPYRRLYSVFLKLLTLLTSSLPLLPLPGLSQTSSSYNSICSNDVPVSEHTDSDCMCQLTFGCHGFYEAGSSLLWELFCVCHLQQELFNRRSEKVKCYPAPLASLSVAVEKPGRVVELPGQSIESIKSIKSRTRMMSK